ncbi:unnamed protein product [Allacma fusca]|uniref:Fatty acyl-CoA reductase n=1 Tax=Allacma fusca TaxID=39272 RepID=A0A8J2LDH7_9HEXA|nr:unnamed protein product [Allacma fusca]
MNQFYCDKVVFITGAAGYIGKSILEKLLRSCPQVKKIYVLIRGKHNQSGEERLQNILREKFFEKVRCSDNSQDLFAKIVVIDGDITLDGLGITPEKTDILKYTVSIVLHVAANVRLNAGLKLLVKGNTEGIRNVLKWSKQLQHLKAFVYVSTAFSNSHLEEIDEIIYPPTVDPLAVMQLCSSLPAELVDFMAEKLLGKHKNCYTYSKHLAEYLVHEARFDLPVCIVRPAIVGPADREPFPGWVDNFNGMSGFIVGMAHGIIRCLYTNKQGALDVVPLDHVVNLILTAAMEISSKNGKRENDVIVYNCSNTENPFAHRKVHPHLYEAYEKTPFNEMLWYPSVAIVRSKIVFTVLNFLLHYLPALVADGVATLIGKKPRMLKIYYKVQSLSAATRDVQRADYRILTENTKALYESLDRVDQECFYFRNADVNLKNYFHNCVYGLKFYLMKEEQKDLPEARKHFKRMRMLYRAVWGFVYVFVIIWLLAMTFT